MPLPGTKFKRTKAVALDSPVSLLFGDMPLGAEKTFELGQGPNDALEYLFNFPVADEITYGSGEVVGLKFDISTYAINMIEQTEYPNLFTYYVTETPSIEGAIHANLGSHDDLGAGNQYNNEGYIYTSLPTPALATFGEDFSDLAEGFVEVDRISHIESQSDPYVSLNALIEYGMHKALACAMPGFINMGILNDLAGDYFLPSGLSEKGIPIRQESASNTIQRSIAGWIERLEDIFDSDTHVSKWYLIGTRDRIPSLNVRIYLTRKFVDERESYFHRLSSFMKHDKTGWGIKYKSTKLVTANDVSIKSLADAPTVFDFVQTTGMVGSFGSSFTIPRPEGTESSAEASLVTGQASFGTKSLSLRTFWDIASLTNNTGEVTLDTYTRIRDTKGNRGQQYSAVFVNDIPVPVQFDNNAEATSSANYRLSSPILHTRFNIKELAPIQELYQAQYYFTGTMTVNAVEGGNSTFTFTSTGSYEPDFRDFLPTGQRNISAKDLYIIENAAGCVTSFNFPRTQFEGTSATTIGGSASTAAHKLALHDKLIGSTGAITAVNAGWIRTGHAGTGYSEADAVATTTADGGSGLTVNINEVSGGAPIDISMAAAGTGYTPGDFVTITTGGANCKLLVRGTTKTGYVLNLAKYMNSANRSLIFCLSHKPYKGDDGTNAFPSFWQNRTSTTYHNSGADSSTFKDNNIAIAFGFSANPYDDDGGNCKISINQGGAILSTSATIPSAIPASTAASTGVWKCESWPGFHDDDGFDATTGWSRADETFILNPADWRAEDTESTYNFPFNTWLDMYIEFKMHSNEFTIYITTDEDSADAVTVPGGDVKVLAFRGITPCAAVDGTAGKTFEDDGCFPNNLSIWLNNTKSNLVSTGGALDWGAPNYQGRELYGNSPEHGQWELPGEHWPEHTYISSKVTREKPTDSEVLIDGLSFRNWFPPVNNHSVYTYENIGRRPISLVKAQTRTYNDICVSPSGETTAATKDATKTYNDGEMLNDSNLTMLFGHKTSALGQGDKADHVFFHGFKSFGRAGVFENLQALDTSDMLFSAKLAASMDEPRGFQYNNKKMDSQGIASAISFAAGSGNKGFKHKGAISFQYDDSGYTGNWAAGTKAVIRKREHILASSMVLKVIDSKTVVVATADNLKLGKDATYVVYKYGADYAASTAPEAQTGCQIDAIKGNTISFKDSILTSDSGAVLLETGIVPVGNPSIFISPEAYWTWFQMGFDEEEDREFASANYFSNDTNDNVAIQTDGVTYNEILFGRDGVNLLNANAWNLSSLTEDSALETTHDFGFGDLEEDSTGYVARSPVITTNRTEIDLTPMLEYKDVIYGDILSFLIRNDSISTTSIWTNNATNASDAPNCITEFFDELPTIENFIVKPNEENPYYPEFSWETNADDLWYGLLYVDNDHIINKYHDAVFYWAGNDAGIHGETITDSTIIGDADEGDEGLVTAHSVVETNLTFDMEGLAGNATRFNGSDSEVKISTDVLHAGEGGAGLMYNVGRKFTFVAHVTPDADMSGTNFIWHNDGRFEVWVDTSGKIQVKLNYDTNAYITLSSSSRLIKDGQTPTSVIVTFNGRSTSANVKLFINGNLEDQTGMARIDSSDSDHDSWHINDPWKAVASDMDILIGSNGAGSSWKGKMEEIILYNDVLYPVPTDGSNNYIFTDHLSELSDTASTSSKSYSAKIFLFDYHNIRGKRNIDVATAPQASFRKAAFRIDNT